MLSEIKSGAIDVVIVYHTDRLYRNRKDTYRFLEMAIAANVSVYADKSPDLDLSTASGRMVADILASVSRQESERESERVIRSNIQRAEKGVWHTTHRTFGYTVDGQPLEPEATAIRQAVVDVLAGVSLQAIAKRWNDAGLKTTLAGRDQVDPISKQQITITGLWNGRRVRRILLNPKLAAIKINQGKKYPGNWTPLVDRDTHEGLVRFLSDSARVCGTSFERKYLGSSLYRCGVCGGTMKVITKGAWPIRRPSLLQRKWVRMRPRSANSAKTPRRRRRSRALFRRRAH
jgi:site-specific DNA recombinase